MVYQGSKARLAKDLVPIIESIMREKGLTTYVELMCGGCNLIDKVQAENKIANDINERLIKLLKYVRDNPTIPIAPKECSFEHYKDVRENQFTGKYSDEYVALIGYCASYGGRYFDGGYGRDSKGGRSIYSERIAKLKEQAPKLKGIALYSGSYKDLSWCINPERCLFYFDPPYRDTKTYLNKSFDYNEFYNFLRELKAKGCTVLVSEYSMPDDFTCIWSKERTVLQKSDRKTGDKVVEKLFTL